MLRRFYDAAVRHLQPETLAKEEVHLLFLEAKELLVEMREFTQNHKPDNSHYAFFTDNESGGIVGSCNQDDEGPLSPVLVFGYLPNGDIDYLFAFDDKEDEQTSLDYDSDDFSLGEVHNVNGSSIPSDEALVGVETTINQIRNLFMLSRYEAGEPAAGVTHRWPFRLSQPRFNR